MKSFFKALYRLIPFKAQLFSFLRIFWKPGERIFRHLHFRGVFTVKIDAQQKFRMYHGGFQIENEIFWRGLLGGWEKESMKLWIKLCERSEVILDIGANTGVYALVAKSVNPRSEVFAFEPHPMYYGILKKNILLNSFDIHPVQKAVSDSDEKAVIEDFASASATIITECIALDSFIEQHHLKRIDLMKIDVERHEPQVLEGFRKYLSRYRPSMLIEILDDETGEKVFSYVRDLGYLFFNIDEKGSVRRTDDIGKSDYYNYLLCTPEVAAAVGLQRA